MKNETTRIIKEHKSIRKFIDRNIEEDLLDEILDSGRFASSHHNIQAYSIIVIRDKEKKSLISKIAADQKWIIDAPIFIIISMDFNRINYACEKYNKKIQVDEIETIIIGSVDSALVAQNIMISAESFGLGGVIIGGIRNNVEEIIKLLNLPDYTFPLFGICLGYPDPDQVPWNKPRFPKKAVIFDEVYNEELIRNGMEEYEVITEDYYIRRTDGNRTDGWPKQMSEYISKERRPFIKDSLIKQGFMCK